MKKPVVGVGVACFIWKDGVFLMQRRFGAHGTGTWSVPGGHLEYNESWEACASREVMEETGMTITNIRFLAITNDVFETENKHYVTIWLESDWKSGQPNIMESDKCTAQAWHGFNNLPEPLFEPCWQNLRTIRPELFD